MDGFFDESFTSNFKVAINSSGKVLWEFGGISRTHCSINIEMYPYDTQTCELVITLWRYSIDFVRIVAQEPFYNVIHDTNLWKYEGGYFNDEIRVYPDYATARYQLTFKRKPLYYMVNIILPLVMLLVISFGVFWMPAESGEKCSLGITVLLAASVFQLILSSYTPVNSDVTPKISMCSLYFCYNISM